MTYIIISFNVEGWMAAAQKKTWQHGEKKKKWLDIGCAAIYLLVESLRYPDKFTLTQELHLCNRISSVEPLVSLSKETKKANTKRSKCAIKAPWTFAT